MVRCPETLWHLVVTLPSNPHSEATRLRGRVDEGGRLDKRNETKGERSHERKKEANTRRVLPSRVYACIRYEG